MTLQKNIQNHINKTRFFKAALLVLFFSIAGGGTYFFLTQQNESYNYDVQAENEEVVDVEDTSTKIENPKFYGFDMEKNPFTVIAKEGTQLTENVVELSEVFSEIHSDKQLINVAADSANMVLDNKNIHLDNHVLIVIDKEYNITTEHAEIDLKNSYARGNSPIRMQSKAGLVEGNSFEVTDNFNTVIIKNGVHTNLTP